MKLNVNVFDTKSIESAVSELKHYSKRLRKAEDIICEELIKIGAEVIDVQYSMTGEEYDLMYQKTEDGYVLMALGDNVMFLEFGTGVMTASDYGESLGLTIVEPGMWSQTEGRGFFRPGHEYWYWHRHKYTGTIATKGFLFATQEMKEQAERIVKRVIKK